MRELLRNICAGIVVLAIFRAMGWVYHHSGVLGAKLSPSSVVAPASTSGASQLYSRATLIGSWRNSSQPHILQFRADGTGSSWEEAWDLTPSGVARGKREEPILAWDLKDRTLAYRYQPVPTMEPQTTVSQIEISADGNSFRQFTGIAGVDNNKELSAAYTYVRIPEAK